MNEIQAFDYKHLDRDIRSRIIDATTRLHVLERKTGEQVLEIGRILIEVKAALGHGQFGAWLESEFGWTYESARRFMRVAEVFGENTQIVGFALSALYALASGTVSDEVRQEFIAKAEAGERVTHRDVKARIATKDIEAVRESMYRPATLRGDEIPSDSHTELADACYELSPRDEASARGNVGGVNPQLVEPSAQELRDARREQAKREQETSERILSLVGDADGTVAMTRLKKNFTAARAAAQRDLFALEVNGVASVLDKDDRVTVGWFITDARRWLTDLESAMKRPIRLVDRKGA